MGKNSYNSNSSKSRNHTNTKTASTTTAAMNWNQGSGVGLVGGGGLTPNPSGSLSRNAVAALAAYNADVSANAAAFAAAAAADSQSRHHPYTTLSSSVVSGMEMATISSNTKNTSITTTAAAAAGGNSNSHHHHLPMTPNNPMMDIYHHQLHRPPPSHNYAAAANVDPIHHHPFMYASPPPHPFPITSYPPSRGKPLSLVAMQQQQQQQQQQMLYSATTSNSSLQDSENMPNNNNQTFKTYASFIEKEFHPPLSSSTNINNNNNNNSHILIKHDKEKMSDDDDSLLLKQSASASVKSTSSGNSSITSTSSDSTHSTTSNPTTTSRSSTDDSDDDRAIGTLATLPPAVATATAAISNTIITTATTNNTLDKTQKHKIIKKNIKKKHGTVTNTKQMKNKPNNVKISNMGNPRGNTKVMLDPMDTLQKLDSLATTTTFTNVTTNNTKKNKRPHQKQQQQLKTNIKGKLNPTSKKSLSNVPTTSRAPSSLSTITGATTTNHITQTIPLASTVTSITSAPSNTQHHPSNTNVPSSALLVVPSTTTHATSTSTTFRDKSRETPITKYEYENVTALFQQFCQLPLLAEFTQPLAKLHPELATLYHKIISHPMDLSYICSNIAQHKYQYTRHIQLDVWRMCSNCVLFHSDPRAQKENVAIPSFVSIAVHLRDYFNSLWEEYMVPSSPSSSSSTAWTPTTAIVEEHVVEAVEVIPFTSISSNTRNATATTSLPIVAAEPVIYTTPMITTSRTAPSGKSEDHSHSASNIISSNDHVQHINNHDVGDFGCCSVIHPPHVFQNRIRNRKARFVATANIPLSYKACLKAAAAMQYFLDTKGRVDAMDVDPLFHDTDHNILSQQDQALVMAKITQMRKCCSQCAEAKHKTMIEAGAQDSDDEDAGSTIEISIHEIQDHFHSITNLPCFTTQAKSQQHQQLDHLRRILKDRLDRLLHKIMVPIYEAGCRGVNQSSIWGCMAAAIWARESSRKPYWPALVLGILAPEDQSEEWHLTLTERNEGRFPEKLRVGLAAGKKKAAIAIEKSKGKDDQMSYFLVEFLGKHQFTWVREADILENFDPIQDPNGPTTMPSDGTGGSKKHRKHTSHSVADTPAYNTAVQECQWAVEEFEMQVRDPCGDLYSMEDDDDEEDEDVEASLSKYSFAILAQSSQQYHRDSTVEETDDEGEALYATQGFIDVTVEGRKKFMALSALAKRQREAATRKEKAGQIKREKAVSVIKSKTSKHSIVGGSGSSITKKSAIIDTITPRAITVDSEVRTSTKKRKVASGGGMAEKHPEQQSSNKRLNIDKTQHNVSTTSKGVKKRSNVIPDKKSKACAKVRAYVTKLIQKGLVIPNAAHPATVGSGTSGTGNSHHSVDTSGFLGMALAFRAAAGEIPGVAPIDESSVRPWDLIDITESKDPQERRTLIKKKIELLQIALNTLEKENSRREQILESIQCKKLREGSIIPTVLDNAYEKNDVAVIPSTEKATNAVVSANGSLSHSTGTKPQRIKENALAAVNYGTAKDETNSSQYQEEFTSSESDAETEDDDSQGIQW